MNDSVGESLRSLGLKFQPDSESRLQQTENLAG